MQRSWKYKKQITYWVTPHGYKSRYAPWTMNLKKMLRFFESLGRFRIRR